LNFSVSETIEFDLHIHTSRYSGCSNIDSLQVIQRARAVGLNGIALTEHGIRWPDREIEALVARSGVKDFLVIPGEEAACYSSRGKFQGEFLVFGYPKSLGSSKSIDQVIELVHEVGGIILAAHPFKRQDNGDGFYGCGDAVYTLNIDGLEIEHPSYDSESRNLAKKAMESRSIAGIGNSDSHDLNSIGICRTVFTRRVDNIRILCEEIRARRVRAVNMKDSLIRERTHVSS